MRKLVCWFVLAGLAWGVPVNVQAQENYFVPPVPFTGPFSHPRYENGGFFVALSGLYMRQTRPLEDQQIGFRGFFDTNGSLSGNPGSFVGSGAPALSTEQLRPPGRHRPGVNITAGGLLG